ncbi:ThiJ/PfpI family protein [Bradyrhizobium lupini HPC(L)]|uniref:ThiJ/PfpI family protein n=1 Tax=Bradyrhizobium lupini HPC(L) TaxID=1229491 RepID=A0ABN0HJH0_RHILU|nr:ThiJ/PfpI family protein [Bradyrhizobium lupini HPC(L)]
MKAEDRVGLPWAHRAAVDNGRFEGLVGQVEMSGSAKPQTNWIYVAYRFTVFSNREEEMAKGRLGGGTMKVYSQDGSPGGRTVRPG